MMERLADKIRAGGRIDPPEALRLWHEAPLWLLSELATGRKRAVSGDKVFYNRNFHVEPTNVCAFRCQFCSYRRPADAGDAWDHSLNEIEELVRARATGGATEVHIVGGVHPDHDLAWYEELIRRVRRTLPGVSVKAFTAVELVYMCRKSGVSIEEGLERLKSAGVEAIPGGGAEIFDEGVRARVCPDKASSAEWLAVHAAAHRAGIPTNATMLYGHVEAPGHRVDHLDRLRRQQDETGGFDAFVPLKFRSANNALSHLGEVSVLEDLRTLALSRIYLDNIPHLKAYWVMYGKPVTELALTFGADDIDGTIDDSTKIYSMAGGEEKPTLTLDEIHRMAASAGLRAVERDTFYNESL